MCSSSAEQEGITTRSLSTGRHFLRGQLVTNPKSDLCTVLTRWNTTENNINSHAQHTNVFQSLYFKWNKNRLLFINTLRFDRCQGHNCPPGSTNVVPHMTDSESKRK